MGNGPLILQPPAEHTTDLVADLREPFVAAILEGRASARPRRRRASVREALSLLEGLGLARVGNGHDLLARAADFSCAWGVSGYNAVYLALAALSDGIWLTADARAAAKVRRKGLVKLLGT